MIIRKLGLFAMLIVALVAFALPLPALAEIETYMIDPAHSMANFKIRHLFAKVSGTFAEVTGKIWIDRNNLSAARVEATINVVSIDTNHQKRDTHLLSTDFFNVKNSRIPPPKKHYLNERTVPLFHCPVSCKPRFKISICTCVPITTVRP